MRTHLCFSTSYFTVDIRFIANLKLKKIANHENFVICNFCNYVIVGEHIQNMFATVFPKLIFHQ